MGPKAKGKEMDDNLWRKRIEEAPLDEETWHVKAVMIECAGGDQDRIYLNKFEAFATEERRFVIKNICKTETIFMVNQLGSEKKVRDESLRVFEEGQAFLKDKKDIPPDILALIIKHLILKMKDEYLFIRRQKLEVKEGLRRESFTMISKDEVRGSVSTKPPESAPVTPPKKSKVKGKGEPEPLNPEPAEGKKYNTVLRERGEEWRDRVYVDDFPTDGPNLYVAITGFMEPFLASYLVRLGIPLSAIVQIRIDPTAVKVPSTLIRATKRGQSQTDIMAEKSLKFWEDLQELRIQKNSADDFKNTAFIIFTPPYWQSENLTGNPDIIYDEICFLMYDVQDLSRQHVHFLDNMDIILIPDDTIDERYIRRYSQQIDDLPLECLTIYSLLDSILRTSSRDNLDESNSRSSLSAAVTLNKSTNNTKENDNVVKAKTLVRNVFDTLCKTDTDKKIYRVTYGEEYESFKDPIVLKYGDFVKNTTFHLGNINLDNIVGSTLFGMPIHKLWLNQNPPEDEAEAKINFHVNVLLSCFDRSDVETAELDRLLHILSCRKLYNNRSSLKKNHLQSATINSFKKTHLKRSILAEPLPKCPSLYGSTVTTSPSFPSMTKYENSSHGLNEEPKPSEAFRIKFLFDCPDISELVSAAEIANNQPINHMIDDFEYFEDFSGVRSFQVMLDAFNKFNCVDYKYCEVTDSIILMFFNSHNKDGIAREEWRCHLPTPLCLQDFFDFVLEEHYDWIQNEENLYDQTMIIRKQSECRDIVDPLAAISCIDDAEVQIDLLMEGSLKHQEYVQVEESSNQDATEKTVVTTAASSKKSPSSPTFTDVDSKSSKKAKSADPSPRKQRQSFVNLENSSLASENIVKKPFQGYDLGDRRVEVFGRDAAFFSRDGSRISSYYTLLIPMNIEYIALNLVPGNSYNEVWVHKALGEFVAPEIYKKTEMFRINSKDQVMFNIKKEYYKVPLNLSSSAVKDTSKPKDTSVKMPSANSVELFPEFETKHYYSFRVTWPNGLITESVNEENSRDISHIKQHHVIPLSHLDEEMRCISLRGEVVIFKTSGDIEVLKPDGTYIYITKYEKRVVVPEVPEEVSEVSSEKNKKTKGKSKDKVQGKPSKHFPKEVEEEEKPLQYELVINEFEIIETSGLRQKWVNDESVDIEKLLIRTATEYCLGEIFTRRMDGTHILLNKDGVQIVTYQNKTRIITRYVVEEEEIYPEWTDEEREYFEMFEPDPIERDTIKSKGSVSQKSYHSGSITSSESKKNEDEEKEKNDGYISVQIVYIIEHPNFTTVTIDKTNGKITVDSPNNTSLSVNLENHYEIALGHTTTATFNGDDLNVSYEACPKCKSFTTCNIKIETDFQCSIPTDDNSLPPANWVKMKDSFCKKVVVDYDGNIDLLDEPCSQMALGFLTTDDAAHGDEFADNREDSSKVDGKSENSMTSHGKCREVYQAKNVKFIVLQRDLTCSELIHRAILEQYVNSCRWQPWCNISQYDTFADNRTLHSILTPINVTETEKWLMESKMSNKPMHLTYKHLKEDTGKGFYHWMRPYERYEPKPMKPDSVLTHRLPRAYVLRTLEQQWKEQDREKLKGGKELLNAILRYRHVIEAESDTILHVPIVDVRPMEERRIDDLVQAVGHRIYKDLKMRLEEDVQTRARATITTKPPPPPEEMSVEGEMDEEEELDIEMFLAEERASTVRELEDASPTSTHLQKYWRRRAEERKEEDFYLYLLREGSVPQYFRNILGGAIWWDMNQAAGDAVTKAESRKMKCICAEEEGTSQTVDSTLLPPLL